MPTSQFHQRFDLSHFEKIFREYPESELSREFSASPFDIFSVECLRSKVPEQEYTRIPVDIAVWGRGEPDNPAGTKIGGVPLWLPEIPIPSNLKFLGQFNFGDSLDILPPLPEVLLSVWVDCDFPYSDIPPTCQWLDAERAIPVKDPESFRLHLEGHPRTLFCPAS